MKEIKGSGVIFEKKEADDGSLLVSGYIGTFRDTPDSWGDIVKKGAYTKTISERKNKIKFLLNHNQDKVLGSKCAEIFEDSKGCFVVDARIEPTSYGKDAAILIKAEAINSYSIGYEAIKKAYDGDTRIITEIKLWEYSAVPFPADDAADITAYKSRIRKAADIENMLDALQELQSEIIHGRAPEKELFAKLSELKATIDAIECKRQPQPTQDSPDTTQPPGLSELDALLTVSITKAQELEKNLKDFKGR